MIRLRSLEAKVRKRGKARIQLQNFYLSAGMKIAIKTPNHLYSILLYHLCLYAKVLEIYHIWLIVT